MSVTLSHTNDVIMVPSNELMLPSFPAEYLSEFELVTREFELATRKFELVTRGFELVTHISELVTHNSCFTFPLTRSSLLSMEENKVICYC